MARVHREDATRPPQRFRDRWRRASPSCLHRFPRAAPQESPEPQEDRGGRHRDEPEGQDPTGPRARVAERWDEGEQDAVQAEDLEQAPHGDPGEGEGERQVR